MAGNVRFGAFEFDPDHRVLRKHGLKIRVPGQSLEILAALVEHPGETLSRERIRTLLWPHGTVVEFEQSIGAAVKRLREAIGDPSNNPRFIERVPRQGYRFIAPVERMAPEPPCAPDIRPGAALLHYRLVEKTGQGSMGEVWRAEDTKLGRIVALKILPERLADDPGALEAFRAEARHVAALSDPGVCTIHCLEEHDGRWFLVMEYISGYPLSTVLAGEPLPLTRILDIGIQAAAALSAAHTVGIIHRDLKPANFMLNAEGRLKLTDFGLALATRGNEPVPARTGRQSPGGTLEYMSPEQARGDPADPRSDLFSLGVVLYEMATGKVPFHGDTAPAILDSILHEDPAPPRARNPKLPRELDQLILKALAKIPAGRWQTAVDVADVLRRIQHARTSRRLRLRRWAYASAAIAAIVLTTGLWPPPQPKVRVTPLTSDASWKYDVLLVSDGRVLYTAGVSTAGLGNDFWSVPAAGGEPRRDSKPCVTEISSPYLFSVSYPQRRMLVQCQEPISNGVEAQFWLVGFDQAQARWIGRWSFLDEPGSISPDLRTLLFNTRDSVFVKPVDGGQQQLVVRVDRSAPIAASGWHPSGAKLIVSRWMDGARKLWEVRTDGAGLHQLLPDFSPAQEDWTWSPDGRRLYFMSGGDIYLLGVRGWLGWMHRPAPVRLTSGPIHFGAPFEDPSNPLRAYARGTIPQVAAMKLNRKTNVFEPFLGGIPADSVEYSPDRQWIAYVPWPYTELWKSESNGSHKTLLVEGLHCVAPHWSPDGTRISFTAWKGNLSDPSQQHHIYLISAAGGQPELVPGVPGPGSDPVWSPDGKRLAFAAARPHGEGTKEQQHVSIVNLESGAVEAVPGSDDLWSPRWSPDGNSLVALGPDNTLRVYRFSTGHWTTLGPEAIQFPHWSKDSRSVFALVTKPAMTLVRIPVAAPGKIEEIRKIQEFTMEWSAYWTPDDEPIVLRDLTSYQIYRIDRDR